MDWLVFSYSLPKTINSSSRVAVWRRLGRLGAVAPKAGVYVLPDKEDCFESFQWLVQEVQQNKGEAVIMKVNKFEGLPGSQLVKFFQEARKDDYDAIDLELDNLERDIHMKGKTLKALQGTSFLKKIRNQFAEINNIDFFHSPRASHIRTRIHNLEKGFNSSATRFVQHIPKASIQQYKSRRWVTRPKPHVDRLACAWLISRFIDPKAVIRYSDTAKQGEIAFDMKGVAFGHQGDFCSFETMIHAFNFKDRALETMAEIIHAIDLKDGRYIHPEIEGVVAILNGWRLANFSDSELESHGIALFEGLYTALNQTRK